MEYIQLTKRENQVMDILWKENHKMSANEIAQTTEGLSIYTVSQVLQHLLSIGYVKVSGIGKKKNQLLVYTVPVFLNLNTYLLLLRKKHLKN